MQGTFRKVIRLLVLPLFALFLSACAESTEISIPVIARPSPTSTEAVIMPTEIPPPPKTLVVCLGREPSSLFIYDDVHSEADTVLPAIYDGPLEVRGFGYEPVILTKLPSLNDGDAMIEEVVVSEGEVYLNPLTHSPDILEPQMAYLPAGCHQQDCIRAFTEGEVMMDRLVVEFELLPEILWSDGEALKASDSVYSFHVDSNEAIPTTKYLVNRTSSYVALDDLRVQWSGIPGFMDPEFESNFWTPLPEHILGTYPFEDLSTVELASRFPIGWGPYEIVSWEPGDEIVMRRSDLYFRADQGLPYFELVRFRFLGLDYISALEQTLTGECDILDESVFPASQWEVARELVEGGRMKVYSSTSMLLERIDFNLAVASLSPQTPYLLDVRMRQSLAACIDREGLVEAASLGYSKVVDSYLPASHPEYVVDADVFMMSRTEAIDQLAIVGWRDHDQDPDTPRVAQGIPGVIDGTPLSFTFLTSDDDMHRIIAEKLAADLSQCGVGLELEFGQPDELFTPWPNGPIFGGRFDLVGWAWPAFVSPPCEMFAGFEIPSVDHVFGINASGFRDAGYDQECQRILYGPAHGDDYLDAVHETQSILQSQLPFIPLFTRPRLIASGDEICGVELDPSSLSVLWNLEEIDRGENCTD